MNILAATAQSKEKNEIYNEAVGDRTNLNTLFDTIKNYLVENNISLSKPNPIYRDFREGDVRHSQADISKAKEKLGVEPSHTVQQGLKEAMPWYIDFIKKQEKK